jgi:hypothetical protein
MIYLRATMEFLILSIAGGLLLNARGLITLFREWWDSIGKW